MSATATGNSSTDDCAFNQVISQCNVWALLHIGIASGDYESSNPYANTAQSKEGQPKSLDSISLISLAGGDWLGEWQGGKPGANEGTREVGSDGGPIGYNESRGEFNWARLLGT